MDKWDNYAEAHRRYRLSYSPKVFDYRCLELQRLGWMEIPVCPTTDLHELLTPELTGLICSFFQSEFAVVYRGEMEREQGEMDESALWHRDEGPLAHLRLLVPLVESTGGTAVISLTETVDYNPMCLADRLPDLTGLGEHTPWLVTPPVGEGLIMQSTRTLHRAVPTGARRIFQCGFIPWNEPWEVFEKEHGELMTNANAFPNYKIK